MVERALDVDEKLERWANNLECRAAEIVPELLAESCPGAASEIMEATLKLILVLRERAQRVRADRGESGESKAK